MAGGAAHAVPDANLNAAALAAGADNKDDATYLLRCAPDAALSPASAAHADRATRALAAATAAQAEGYPALPPAETPHGRLAFSRSTQHSCLRRLAGSHFQHEEGHQIDGTRGATDARRQSRQAQGENR